MKRILTSILSAVLLVLLWASVILFRTVEDWFHQPIDKLNTSTSFIDAVE